MRAVQFVDQPPDLYGPLRIPRRRDFEVDGAGFFAAHDGLLIAPFGVIGDASLTSLRDAVRRYSRRYEIADEPVQLLVTHDSPETFDEEGVRYIFVTRLWISARAILIEVEQPTSGRVSHDAADRLLRPLLDRSGSSLQRVTHIEDPEGEAVEVSIAVSSRGRTVGQALDLGDAVSTLLEAAFVEGRLSPSTVGDVLRAGQQDALVGQPESDWLEAKDRLYELDDVGRFKLAGDVAAFANAAGGLIAIGMRTRKVRGEDVIAKARPVPLKGFDIARHKAVVRNWIFPPPKGVRFDLALTQHEPEYGLVIIEIPEQPEALKPFFVRRAHVAGRVRTEHLALPVRDGADTSHWEIAELHSLIVAGRAALAAPRHPSRESEPPAADRRRGSAGVGEK